jgi:hypothetical protein
MGADVYLRSKHEAHKLPLQDSFNEAISARNAVSSDHPDFKKLQAKVNSIYEDMYSVGYFRDSYNHTSLLNSIGLSWWIDVIPMLDDESTLPIDKAMELRSMIATKELNPSQIHKAFGSFEEVEKYLLDKKQRLIALLDESIETGEPLLMSL